MVIDPKFTLEATASATLTIDSVAMDSFGSGYVSDPTVTITDASGTGDGATATAFTDLGAITEINVTAGGTGYITTGGIKKFQDGLPMLCVPTTNFADCSDPNTACQQPGAVHADRCSRHNNLFHCQWV